MKYALVHVQKVNILDPLLLAVFYKGYYYWLMPNEPLWQVLTRPRPAADGNEWAETQFKVNCRGYLIMHDPPVSLLKLVGFDI